MGDGGVITRPSVSFLVVGPPVCEPSESIRKFMCRDEHRSLLAYWMSNHMGKIRWWVLCEMLRKQMKREGNRCGRIIVPGFGTIGGVVS